MKILLVAARFPFPARRGDQMRAAQLVDLLEGEHQVTLLAPAPAGGPAGAPGGDPEAPERPRRLETYRPRRDAATLLAPLWGGHPYQAGLFGGTDLRRQLRRLAAGADIVVLQTVRLAGHAGDLGGAPLVVDFIDSLALNLRRRAAVDRPWMRPAWRHEAARLERSERRLLEASRRAVVVCERDRECLGGGLSPAERERVGVVPIAVAADSADSVDGGGGGPVVAFTGNLGYFVNADAARWLLRHVWPEVHRRRPDARLLLAGDRPGPGLRRAARALGVELLAEPADLRPLLRCATVAVAPMRCGSGQPMKVIEAWAAGVPVVGSAWALAGTAARAGEEYLPAGEPREWVEAILRVFEDAPLRRRLAEAGRERLRADYSPEAVGRAWREVIASAAG